MSMYQEAGDIKEEYAKEIEEIKTVRMVWLIVRLCKATRRYCRGNVAFNNFMNTVFDDFNFKVVQKEKQDGTPYAGLNIVESE